MPSRVPLMSLVVIRNGIRTVVPPGKPFAFTPNEVADLDARPDAVRTLINEQPVTLAGDLGPLDEDTKIAAAGAGATHAAATTGAVRTTPPARASKVPARAGAVPVTEAAADL